MPVIGGGGVGIDGGGGDGPAGTGNVAVAFNPHVAVTSTPTTSMSTEGMPEDLQLGRVERETVIYAQGQRYRVIGRNKADASDWVVSGMLASLKALRNKEEYLGTPAAKRYRDALLQGEGDI